VKPIAKSSKLANVCYDIRGPVLDKARQMEEEGHKIIKLNIGNLAVFGLEPPDEIVQDMIRNLPHRRRVHRQQGPVRAAQVGGALLQEKGIQGVTVDDVYLGNGASELIVMSPERAAQRRRRGAAARARLPAVHGRRVAVRRHAGALHLRRAGATGTARHRRHPRQDHAAHQGHRRHQPEQPDRRAVPRQPAAEIVEIARQHQLIVFADEIYDKTLYDGNTHTSIASLADDVLFVTFNGLSKNYRSCGYRAGWMVVSGDKRHAKDYIEGLNMLASMRLCANTPGQLAIQTALGGYQSIKDLVAPTGRLCRQRDLAYEMLNADPGCQRGQAQGGAVHVPAPGPQDVPDRRRPAVRLRAAGREEGADRAGHGLQLAAPDHFRLVFLPNSRRPGRGHRAHRPLPGTTASVTARFAA
jgi:alanine-synthesizing transaminase